MKHAILGAGAIGGLMGTALASLGEEVVVVVRPERLAGYPERLTLERPAGSIQAPARAVSRLTEPVDALWIATRTFQMQAALEAVQTQPAAVIPLLNGVDHVAALRERFGHERIVPATIAVEAERLAPGHFVQRSPFVRFAMAGAGEARFGALVTRLGELGFTCQFIANEQTLLWSKLCFLAPFALVTSAAGKSVGEVRDDPEGRQRMESAIDEAVAVATAEGASVDAAKLKALIGGSPAAMRSSMQKDLAAGRPLELDSIGGPIVRGAERHGIAVPLTQSLIAAIRAKASAQSA